MTMELLIRYSCTPDMTDLMKCLEQIWTDVLDLRKGYFYEKGI